MTDNIGDYLQIVVDHERAEIPHHGVILCTSRQFDRADPRTIGRMVDALEAFLQTNVASVTPFNQRHWLRRTT